MEEVAERHEVQKINISEKVPVDASIKSEYQSFLQHEGTIVADLKAKVDFSDPHYKQTQEYKTYGKALDHAAVLSDGGRVLKGIYYYDDEKDSFIHRATNDRGENVGYEITWITNQDNKTEVAGEFIGVSLQNSELSTALQLLEARHSALKEMNIHEYKISMEHRTAKVLERMGYTLNFLEDNDGQGSGMYQISF